LTSAQKDASDVLVYLMGLGFVLPPMDFFLDKAEEFDAVCRIL
jgi:hypothetical protein